MDRNIFILVKLLKNLGYEFSKQSVKKTLYSDPNRGVAAITNTLDYHNVQNIVATVPKDSIDKLPTYFLAQIFQQNQHEIVLIKKLVDNQIVITFNNGNSIFQNTEDFSSNWTGIIIAIEQNSISKPKFNKKKIISIFFSCVPFILMLSYISIRYSSYLISIHYFLSIIGLFISFQIIKEQFNESYFNTRFCNLSKNVDCSKVLNSKESILYRNFGLSDASMVYYSFLSIASIINPHHILISITAYLSLPIIFYSIITQIKFGKWCFLCLMVSFVLFIQFSITLIINNKATYDKTTFLLFASLTTILIILWDYTKSLLIQKVRNEDLLIENLTFKRNHHLFIPYYKTLKKVDTSVIRSFAISSGHTAAPIEIMAIINPLCNACKEYPQILTSLLEKYPKKVKLSFLFIAPYTDRSDSRTIISERLLQLFSKKGYKFFLEAINSWYENSDITLWSNKWGKCRNDVYNHHLSEHVIWGLKNKIEGTPTILINGRKFSHPYHIKDLISFIDPIIKSENLQLETTL